MTRYLVALFIILTVNASAKQKDYLQACWQQQVMPLQDKYLAFNYIDNDHRITHSFQPWQTTFFKSSGTIWCSNKELLKSDTLFLWSTSHSKTQLNRDVLLYQNYGSDKLYPATKDMLDDELTDEAHYNPALLINYFYTHRSRLVSSKKKHFACYSIMLNDKNVTLYISKKTGLLTKATATYNADVYGDVTSTISYNDFSWVDNICYAATVYIDNINHKAMDTVRITNANVTDSVVPLLTAPADYRMKEKEVIKPQIAVEKYNDHIYYIDLIHTNGRSLLAVFDSFLLIAEAPLNSENGELVIDAARKIAPGKPVRYFAFSHYHPDYTGGIRPFIHKGATVLCTPSDSAYIQYLADAPHTIRPDSLQLQRQPLHMEFVDQYRSVSDGKYKMEMHFIGGKSAHTNDYLIYYFPEEKVLFEGDLTGISKEGEIRKASARQAGLYNAIKDLKLDVRTIEQSWPLSYGYKTEIPFSDIEQSMLIK